MTKFVKFVDASKKGNDIQPVAKEIQDVIDKNDIPYLAEDIPKAIDKFITGNRGRM